MLKLILANDEEMIRESIRSLINGNALGIDVAASCKNGPETLQAISYRVSNYLLKPYNENQIIETIKKLPKKSENAAVSGRLFLIPFFQNRPAHNIRIISTRLSFPYFAVLPQ